MPHTDPESGTLEVRFQVIARVALLLGQGAAVAKVTGTGLTTPAFA